MIGKLILLPLKVLFTLVVAVAARHPRPTLAAAGPAVAWFLFGWLAALAVVVGVAAVVLPVGVDDARAAAASARGD